MYGVRPCSVHTFGDQLGLVPSTKSKIEDDVQSALAALSSSAGRMRKEYERIAIGFTEIFLIRHVRLRMWWESEDSIQWSSHWKDEL
jgi:hypothetical protein